VNCPREPEGTTDDDDGVDIRCPGCGEERLVEYDPVLRCFVCAVCSTRWRLPSTGATVTAGDGRGEEGAPPGRDVSVAGPEPEPTIGGGVDRRAGVARKQRALAIGTPKVDLAAEDSRADPEHGLPGVRLAGRLLGSWRVLRRRLAVGRDRRSRALGGDELRAR
jgi:hypothetical protein